MVSGIEHTRSERVEYYNLDNFEVSRMSLSSEAVVAFEEERVEVLRLSGEYGLTEVIGRVGFE